MLQSLQLDITVVVNRHTISQGTGNKCSYGSQRRISYFFSYTPSVVSDNIKEEEGKSKSVFKTFVLMCLCELWLSLQDLYKIQ